MLQKQSYHNTSLKTSDFSARTTSSNLNTYKTVTLFKASQGLNKRDAITLYTLTFGTNLTFLNSYKVCLLMITYCKYPYETTTICLRPLSVMYLHLFMSMQQMN